MILAKDLISLLSQIPPNAEVAIYAEGRLGLHLTDTTDNEPCGWIEIGDNEVITPLDSSDHHIGKPNVSPEQRLTEKDYPVYTGDDVQLCPRCQDMDVLPGHRVCSSCSSELYLDEVG